MSRLNSAFNVRTPATISLTTWSTLVRPRAARYKQSLTSSCWSADRISGGGGSPAAYTLIASPKRSRGCFKISSNPTRSRAT
jgi:hypothetical protein